MAMVRDFTSPKPVSFGSQYPTIPPMRWRRRTGIYIRVVDIFSIARGGVMRRIAAGDENREDATNETWKRVFA